MNQYPLWRYLLIIVLIVLGIVYAAPVVYGEDPAIQIKPKSGSSVPATIVQSVSDALLKQKIGLLSIKQQPDNTVLIRFKDTEEQLKAQDVLQATLGDKFVVALNLAPRTPKWLQALGAHPMKLGLDLRGGIHFLLKVVVNAVVKERLVGDVHSMGTQLRNANIRYAGISTDKKTEITIRLRDADAQSKALVLLKKNFPEYQIRGSSKGYNLIAMLSQEAATKIQQEAVTQNITTLRNRVNDLGVSEPVITQQGKDQISVDLPGVQDMARAKEIMGKVATIRFQMVDTEHDAEEASKTGIVPFGDTLYKFEGRPVLVKNQVILSGNSIMNASSIVGENGRPAVSIRAGGGGVSYFSKVTADNIGKPMATIYVVTESVKKIVKGKVVTTQKQVEKIISVATIQSALGNSFQITNLDSMQYAKDLALFLRSGAYSAPVVFIQERLVGPSLGKENIRMGVLSTEVGSLLVILFMAFYYRLFGLVADFALIMNVVFVVAIMAILGATMTLPGIAGIVLTVGMAVDANVLINERIREELRNGASAQAAIYSGYKRAFSTIVDANVTTLIVAVVLFALGSGPVQGFAVVLTIGLLTSMVTSIFFTRAIINLIYGRRSVKQLSIGIKVKRD